MTEKLEPTKIRTAFTKAMSEMYRSEVPKYGTLLSIVGAINERVAKEEPERLTQLGLTLERITEERHGAIRLGTAAELKNIARVFGVMGMYSCNYYDLTVAGHPIHSTCFRPLDRESLAENPFRVFTSLLRRDLLPDEIKDAVAKVLDNRNIFTDRLLELVSHSETNGGLTQEESDEFVTEALKTFKWHKEANISKELYDKLKAFSPIAADIVGFKGPHINHLTPVAIDIDQAFKEMQEGGLQTIDNVQGPPKRKVPILLRQTSFRAIDEVTIFPKEDGSFVEDKHRARFGEIECRGIALTKKGRAYYDELLLKVLDTVKQDSSRSYEEILENVYAEYPDSLSELREKGLAYVHYAVTEKGEQAERGTLPSDVEALLVEGYLSISGIVYEDFLPVSAARIFDSNLDKESGRINLEFDSLEAYRAYEQKMQESYEKDFGQKTRDVFSIYQKEEAESLKACLKKLGL